MRAALAAVLNVMDPGIECANNTPATQPTIEPIPLVHLLADPRRDLRAQPMINAR